VLSGNEAGNQKQGIMQTTNINGRSMSLMASIRAVYSNSFISVRVISPLREKSQKATHRLYSVARSAALRAGPLTPLFRYTLHLYRRIETFATRLISKRAFRRLLLLLAVLLFILFGFIMQGRAAIAILVPDGDVTIEWPTVVGSSGCSTHCGAVNEGDVPDTASYIATNLTNTNYAEEFTMTTASNIDSATQIRLRVYANTVTQQSGADTLTLNLRINGTLQAGVTRTPTAGSYSWLEYTITGNWSQADIDSLQARLVRNVVGTGPTGSRADEIRVASVYIELTYSESIDPELEQSSYRWFENLSTITSEEQFNTISNPASVPNTGVHSSSWTRDNIYLAVGSNATDASRLIIYKQSGDVLTKLSDPATLPGNNVRDLAWSPDGVYLSVVSYNSPYLTIYKRSGDTLSKLTDPSVIPSSFTFATDWSPDGLYLSVGFNASPYIYIYKRDGDTFTKLTDPASLPQNQVATTSWSPDGQYLAVGENSSSSSKLIIYKRSVDTFNKLSDPATMPGDVLNDLGWSPDSRFLSVVTVFGNYFYIYERDGDTFTKLSDPAVMPTNNAYATRWSPDGQYVTVGFNASPWLFIYKRDGTTFTKLSDPSTLPADNVRSTVWSPNGQYLFVGIQSSTFVLIYKNITSVDIGEPLALQDVLAEIPSQGIPFRLRMTLSADLSALGAGDTYFKLQYAQRTGMSCSLDFSAESYADVDTSPTADISFFDNSTVPDGFAIAATVDDPNPAGGGGAVPQSYVESNPFTNQSSIPNGDYGVWDFSLVDNVAPSGTGYCFRIVSSNDELLNTYSVVSEIITSSGANNQAPDAPTLNLPADAATNVNITPTFSMRTTDADNDYLRYRIHVCSTSDCSAILRTIDQTASQTGWTGQDAEVGTAYIGSSLLASSTMAYHVYQAPALSYSTTYYWRAYAADQGGSNTWSLASPIRSFTTQAEPSGSPATQKDIRGGTTIRGGTRIGN
jgi:WD40 repeat protein